MSAKEEEILNGDMSEDDDVDNDATKKDNKKKKKKKPKGKAAANSAPISAAAKAILERKKAQEEADARAQALQDEEDRKYEEALRKEEAEKAAFEAERKRRAEAKKEKIDAQKQAGVYKTKAEKEKERKLKERLEELKASGVNVPVGNSAPSPTGGGSIAAMYKKKPEKKKVEVVEVVEAVVEEDDDDDWETAADNLDLNLDEVEIPDFNSPSSNSIDDDEDMLAKEQRAEKEKLRLLGEERARKEEEAKKKREREANERAELEIKARQAAASRAEAHMRRAERYKKAFESRTEEHLRSPIVCIMGHVDTGKTKLLDKIRKTSVQEGEAGGITQQIGATQFPKETLLQQTASMQTGKHNLAFETKIPGLMVIDTPGHEAFSNLRHRGSNLCDVAILVIDLMHGLEPQTIESINMLKSKNTPFVVALNKVDRCYGWAQQDNKIAGTDIRPFQEALELQDENCKMQFYDLTQKVITQLNEQGLNAALYWKNDDLKDTVSLVPTSAHSGDGIPDLLRMLILYAQDFQVEKIMLMRDYVQCTVLEVKLLDGIGHTIDVILVHGVLKVGDTIVVSTMEGPIVTTIKGLLTPPPNKELRIKSEYVHNEEIQGSTGVKVVANDIQKVIAGTGLLLVNTQEDDIEDVKEELASDLGNVMKTLATDAKGVTVHASTLGALEALLQFLHHECKPPIPVSCINIGPIHKKDIMKCAMMHDKGLPEYATVLAFDVGADAEATALAEESNVKIFYADIIYHLFDQFSGYMNTIKQQRRSAAMDTAVFPAILKIMPQHIFNKKDPIILGVEVVEGTLHIGTPLCVPVSGVFVGKVSSIQNNHKEVKTAKKGSSVAIKIESSEMTYGRQFDHTYGLYSKLTRESINSLKEHFKDDVSKEEWQLVIKMKKTFNIQ